MRLDLLLEHRMPVPPAHTAIIDALKAQFKAKAVRRQGTSLGTGCMGLCSKGPLIRMTAKTQKDVLFSDIKPEMTQEIFTEVVEPSVAAEVKRSCEQPSWSGTTLDLNAPFFTMQYRVVLENNGIPTLRSSKTTLRTVAIRRCARRSP